MWKFETNDMVLGGKMLTATATPELFDALGKQVQALTEKLMHAEEKMVLTSLPDEALRRLETVVTEEIKKRRDERNLHKP